eukprot:4064792-Amphidinium_carterae.1
MTTNTIQIKRKTKSFKSIGASTSSAESPRSLGATGFSKLLRAKQSSCRGAVHDGQARDM